MSVGLFERAYNVPTGKPYADYSVGEMIAYLQSNYPNGTQERLKELYQKLEIGYVLYVQVQRALEGLEYAEVKTYN